MSLETERELIRGAVEATSRRHAAVRCVVRDMSEQYELCLSRLPRDPYVRDLVKATFGRSVDAALVALGEPQ